MDEGILNVLLNSFISEKKARKSYFVPRWNFPPAALSYSVDNTPARFADKSYASWRQD
jgi:hypothetical protein